MDPQQLDQKQNPLMYTGAFVEIYNSQNRRLVHETYEMVKLEKYPISRAEKPFESEKSTILQNIRGFIKCPCCAKRY